MKYSEKDFQDLLGHLKSFGEKYGSVISVMDDHMKRDYFEKTKTASLVNSLENLFPDVIWALTVPEEDLPLYAAEPTGIEAPIARWRLKRIEEPQQAS